MSDSYLLGQISALESTVLALHREKNHWAEAVEQATKVIDQLSKGVQPGQPELIHPLDLMELINGADATTLSFRPASPEDQTDIIGFSQKDGTEKIYRQCIYMPIRSKSVA